MSFPRRRKKVVCKAKRPKHFSSLHGRIKCDLWTCHFELSGAKSEQIARKLTSCSQLLRNRRLQFLLLCWNHLLCKAKKLIFSIAKVLLLLQCQIVLEIVTDPHLGHHFSYIFVKLIAWIAYDLFAALRLQYHVIVKGLKLLRCLLNYKSASNMDTGYMLTCSVCTSAWREDWN